jgi:hypothetical protein
VLNLLVKLWQSVPAMTAILPEMADRMTGASQHLLFQPQPFLQDMLELRPFAAVFPSRLVHALPLDSAHRSSTDR